MSLWNLVLLCGGLIVGILVAANLLVWQGTQDFNFGWVHSLVQSGASRSPFRWGFSGGPHRIAPVFFFLDFACGGISNPKPETLKDLGFRARV